MWRDGATDGSVIHLWEIQVNTTLFVGFIGSFRVDLAEWYFAGALFGEYPERVSHDGIVLDLFLMPVAKDKGGCRRAFRL